MATFTAIKGRGKGSGAMGGVMQYVQQKKKTLWEGQQLVTGYNCTSRTAYLEMQMTKQRFHKTDGRQYYHFVQSFSEQDHLTPQEAHAIGLEFAQKQFPDFEVIVATHVDTDNLHNHLVVNSVSYKTGMKLHQNAADLQQHRQVNDMQQPEPVSIPSGHIDKKRWKELQRKRLAAGHNPDDHVDEPVWQQKM